jgi:hypothetical protein
MARSFFSRRSGPVSAPALPSSLSVSPSVIRTPGMIEQSAAASVAPSLMPGYSTTATWSDDGEQGVMVSGRRGIHPFEVIKKMHRLPTDIVQRYTQDPQKIVRIIAKREAFYRSNRAMADMEGLGVALHMLPSYAGLDLSKITGQMTTNKIIAIAGMGLVASSFRKKGAKKTKTATRIAGILMAAWGLRSHLMAQSAEA